MCYSQYLEKAPTCKFLDVESVRFHILECPFKIKIVPLISMSKSTREDWEDASIRHIFQVLCTSKYITSISKLETSMLDARPRHDKDSANIK